MKVVTTLHVQFATTNSVIDATVSTLAVETHALVAKLSEPFIKLKTKL